MTKTRLVDLVGVALGASLVIPTAALAGAQDALKVSNDPSDGQMVRGPISVDTPQTAMA